MARWLRCLHKTHIYVTIHTFRHKTTLYVTIHTFRHKTPIYEYNTSTSQHPHPVSVSLGLFFCLQQGVCRWRGQTMGIYSLQTPQLKAWERSISVWDTKQEDKDKSHFCLWITGFQGSVIGCSLCTNAKPFSPRKLEVALELYYLPFHFLVWDFLILFCNFPQLSIFSWSWFNCLFWSGRRCWKRCFFFLCEICLFKPVN